MKKSISIPFLLLMTLLYGCSEEQHDNQVSESKGGNKFYHAAVNKLKSASPGMTEQQASCIVDKMTSNGKVGLGEINQMTLEADKMSDNAIHLTDAYYQSIKICLPEL